MSNRKKCDTKIYGRAVVDGVMIKHQENYAVAIRKANGEIEVELENYQGILNESKITRIPFLRGIIKLIDSLILGSRCLELSSKIGEEEGNDSKGRKVLNTLVILFSIIAAGAIFIFLPNYISSLFDGYIRNQSLMAIFENILRIVVFIFYIWGISLMEDVRKLLKYHGAENKCINCLERGRPLTLRNVMRSKRQNKGCETSFVFLVAFISIICFGFVTLENPIYRAFIRLLIIPLAAAIIYEIILLSKKSDNIFFRLLSLPDLLFQNFITREPEEEMVEVSIAAVEAVFDWKQHLEEKSE
ncbi:DUF1385 domain-containing protein [Lachnospiraceae bacterium OttesenSCG-928-D06]|nr:DUF1385 domain-containing protein [Lachnospiraceae bacterium OttesenSCG-928-D06]